MRIPALVAPETLLDIARELTASLVAEDRYARLLDAVRRGIPWDTACLLRLEGDLLVPVASHGLAREASSQLYDRREHPRLDAVLRSAEPLRFPAHGLPADPFPTALALVPGTPPPVVGLGCRLTEGGEVVGALTAHAREPRAFDGLDTRSAAALGALAGAALRAATRFESLEREGARGGTLRERVDRFRRREIRGALARSGGSWAGAARELGMHRSNLYNLAKRLGMLGTGGGRP